MADSLLDFIREQLTSRTSTLETIARESGVPFSTVQRIASGETPSPRIDTVEKLAHYFRDRTAA